MYRIEKFEGQFRSQLKVDREMLQKAQVVGQAFDNRFDQGVVFRSSSEFEFRPEDTDFASLDLLLRNMFRT